MVDLKLELVLVPVTDVDRAKAFSTEKAGFNLDVDSEPSEGFRVVQMTPPGVVSPEARRPRPARPWRARPAAPGSGGSSRRR
jgi:hypothetical protein